MASYNKVMQKFHAYVKADGRRVHLGFYETKDDALEAEKLGKKTDKAWSKSKKAEIRADKVVRSIADRRVD